MTIFSTIRLALALALGCLLAPPAAAQVHKCVDATGKISYSETPCSSSAKQSQQMMGSEATSTYDPYARERTMQSIERARALQSETVQGVTQQSYGPGAVTMDAGRTGGQQARSILTPQPGSVDASETMTPRGPIGGSRADNPNWSPRRGYYGGGGPADQKYEAERPEREAAAARAQANQPNVLTNCNAGGCWDSSGGRYNRTGDGSKLIGPNGQLCRDVGGRVRC